ncbi:hypothetical protein RBB50_004991, partial [Rhinocladiella similis]
MTAAYGTSSSSPQGQPTVSQLVSFILEIERASTELKVWSRRFMSDLVDQAPPKSHSATTKHLPCTGTKFNWTITSLALPGSIETCDMSNQGLAHNLPITATSCSALPFVLEALNLRLSAAAKMNIHQRQLERYADIMRLFRTQHGHAECVTTTINNLLLVVDTEVQHLGPSQVSLRGVQPEVSSRNSKAPLHLST